MGGRNWYPGVVSMLFSDGTHGISYDDGDREARIPRNMIQLLEDPRWAAPQPAATRSTGRWAAETR